MSLPTFALAVRLRLLMTALSALGMVLVIVMVGALFPAVGDSIGKLDLPEGVAELLGGADYGTLTGWMRSEIGAVYGPLVIAAAAITGAAGAPPARRRSGILGLTLAHPVERSRLVARQGARRSRSASRWSPSARSLGLLAGVAVAGGGIAARRPRARSRCTSRSSAARPARWRWRSPGRPAAGRSPRAARRRSRCSASSSTASPRWSTRSPGCSYLSPFHYYAGDDPLGQRRRPRRPGGPVRGRARAHRGRGRGLRAARPAPVMVDRRGSSAGSERQRRLGRRRGVPAGRTERPKWGRLSCHSGVMRLQSTGCDPGFAGQLLCESTTSLDPPAGWVAATRAAPCNRLALLRRQAAARRCRGRPRRRAAPRPRRPRARRPRSPSSRASPSSARSRAARRRRVGVRPEAHEQAGGDQSDGHVALDIQPIPPNILRSVSPGSSSSCARTRSASSSS